MKGRSILWLAAASAVVVLSVSGFAAAQVADFPAKVGRRSH